MDVAPPIEQGPAGQKERPPGWRRLPRDLARRLRPRRPRRSRPEPPPVAPRRPAWRRVLRLLTRPGLLSLLVCLGLSGAIFARIWMDPTTRLLGSGRGDGALMMWFLRWTPMALSHGLNPLFTDYMNFPSGVNVMWNTSLLLPGLLLAPITVAFGPVLTYNLLGTLGLALSAWTATLAFRRYVRSGVAALIGGLAFGFSPYMLAQHRGHLQLSLAFLLPLLFLAVDNILAGQRRPAWLSGLALGVMAGCQVLIGEEVFALAAILIGAQVLLMMLLFPQHILRKAPYAAIAFAVAAVAFVAIAGYPVWFQLFGPQHITGDIQGGTNYVTDLWNFITPTTVQALVPVSATRVTSLFTGNFAETNGYIGIPLILIVLFTAMRWSWSKPVVRVAFLLGLLSVVLSLGDRLHVRGVVTDLKLPWNWLQSLPLLESAVPNRFMLLGMFFFGLLLAFFVDQALRWRWAERLPAALLVIATMVALAPRLPLEAGSPDVPVFFTGTAVHRVQSGGVVLVVPYPSPRSALPMTWQAFADLRYRMPGGYFVGPQANGKPRYGAPPNRLAGQLSKLAAGWDAPNMDPYRRLAYAYNLVQWRVGTVVVGPIDDRKQHASTLKMFTDLLGRPPSNEAGVDVWWDVQPQRLLDETARGLR